MTLVRISSLVLLSLLAAGCGGGAGGGLVPVEGVVTLNGEPLVDAEVTFRPSNGRPSAGRTDAEGRYRLVYMPGEFGAIEGQHSVTISTLREPDSDSSDPARLKGRPEAVPAVYNRKTTLAVTLPDTQRTSFDFSLEKKAKTAGGPVGSSVAKH